MKNFFDSMDFFDFDNLETKGYFQWKIEFCDNIDSVIYSDLHGGNMQKEYREKKILLQHLFEEILACIEEDCCYLKRYNEQWVVRKSESARLWKQLKNDGISNKDSEIIMTEKESPLVLGFFNSIMKYNSFVLFAFPKTKVIIAPTDHMDIFIYSKNVETEYFIINSMKKINLKKEVFQMQKLMMPL